MVKEPQTTRSFHWFSPGFSLVMLEIFRREDEGPEGLALVTNRAAQRSGRHGRVFCWTWRGWLKL